MDIFYKMQGISVNGITVTKSNIDSIGLFKQFESHIADIYTSDKAGKSKRIIVNIKDAKEYSKDNAYLQREKPDLSDIDWSEESLQEEIDYIKERL